MAQSVWTEDAVYTKAKFESAECDFCKFTAVLGATAPSDGPELDLSEWKKRIREKPDKTLVLILYNNGAAAIGVVYVAPKFNDALGQALGCGSGEKLAAGTAVMNHTLNPNSMAAGEISYMTWKRDYVLPHSLKFGVSGTQDQTCILVAMMADIY